jgi:3D-(3,5/4)-trihydroxycyclohexane-1,2-dione acylhydrolase (decyclizing)
MEINSSTQSLNTLTEQRLARSQIIAQAGGVESALHSTVLPRFIDTTVSEALVLGLLLQNVHHFFCIFGHGSTEVGEVLRIYHEVGLLHVHAVRNEIEASHAAVALRWISGEKSAIVTSIGPGALQAFSASIVAASDGIGIWYLMGDETTEDEGLNMQQIPGKEQNSFLKLYSHMGGAYSLHTPLALSTALRRGLNVVDNPQRGGPFFLLLPMNIQPIALKHFNTDELPMGSAPRISAADDKTQYEEAAEEILHAHRIVVKIGGGARAAGPELLDFLELADAVAVTSPLVSGVIPYNHPRNMTVGGSKGSICGNYAMENADLLVAVGSRFVCQSDCSRTGYPNVKHVVNINIDSESITHYGKTTALFGDAGPTLKILYDILSKKGNVKAKIGSPWLNKMIEQKQLWSQHKQKRFDQPILYDEVWKREVLTQPAAIKAATDWARKNEVVNIFDAGDVQANGFQIVEDERLGQTYTETGASYMGFAVSALLASGIANKPYYALAYSGDGSFTMNPQILIDGIEHHATGCILLFDNRRMAAISGLQMDQYGKSFATNDSVEVDYVAWGKSIRGVNSLHGGYSIESLVSALDKARAYNGLSLIHLPVYYGDNELGGMGVFGRWNVGNWSADTQKLRHEIGL